MRLLRGLEEAGGQLGIPVGDLVFAQEEVDLSGTYITDPGNEWQSLVACRQFGLVVG